MFEGVISAVTSNAWNGRLLHSFRLQNDDRYYNCGAVPPPVQEGQLVAFEGVDRGNGKVQVSVGSINVKKDSGTSVVAPTRENFRRPFMKDTSKDEYWKGREERDIKTQEIIQLQSSRNSAIALADLIIKNGGLDLSKVAKKNVQETIENLVDHLTDKFEKISKERRTGAVVDSHSGKTEEITNVGTEGESEDAWG